jgi:putative FmdB family regulatory protein
LPVYEYRCSKGHTYEKTEGFNAPSTQKCATCGARARRQISMPAVIFKGSGFYSTDNRGSGASGGRTSSSDSDSTPAASDNGHSHGPDGHSHPPAADDTKTEASVD